MACGIVSNFFSPPASIMSIFSPERKVKSSLQSSRSETKLFTSSDLQNMDAASGSRAISSLGEFFSVISFAWNYTAIKSKLIVRALTNQMYLNLLSSYSAIELNPKYKLRSTCIG